MNQKILDIVERHLEYFKLHWGDESLLCYGPGHVVYDDYNVEHEFIRFCIQEAETQPLSQYAMFDKEHFTEKEKQELIDDTIRLLKEFLDIPYEECYIWEEEDN